ncbi:MAG: hypothetical protein WBA92_06855 [Pseudorhodobacter sp.]
MAIDRLYVVTAFVWLICGMVFGIFLGITDQLNLSNTHAHMGLLGFVLSILFGLLHRGWPEMREGRLAIWQYGIYQVGAVILVAGKYQIDTTQSSPIVAPGSLIVVLGTALMGWLFLTSAKN